MNHIEALTEQTDLDALALDLSKLLVSPANADIAEEFPSSVARYTGDIETVKSNLSEALEDCKPGVRQQFIAFAGSQAVGMSVIRFTDSTPEGIDNTWPNVSGFICRPFRGLGLGTLSLQTRLLVVKAQFGGNSWTQVKKNNTASNRMVTHAGFVKSSETDGHIIYEYHS